MGLIIGVGEINRMFKGYPTVSDKYNVAGGILEGETNLAFGELVKHGSATGYYEPMTDNTVANVAGICLATNVKLVNVYPAKNTDAQVLPGEAFNLLVNGFVAVELADGVAIDNVKEGAQVSVTAAGKFTVGGTALPGCKFTGITQNIGTAEAPKYLAEIWFQI